MAEEMVKKFAEAMDDDFNTALAISYIFDLSKEINRMVEKKDESALALIASAEAACLNLWQVPLGLLEDTLESLESQDKIEAPHTHGPRCFVHRECDQ